ncbi:alpha/beta fold hydrolase [Thermopolyspora sp. NPDC052614]|uniref:alpha/beta hydrolase family protein n=1 Tax=Thermopolyspora sp. NPDC052614 TaxID=3155682 RepID=UPI0034320EF1
MTDALFTDPPSDAAPPASTPFVTFTSGGERLFGVLHVPAGPGLHPIVVFLHGFPGNERNFDIAQALRRAGYATLVFHYRGSWGVGGSWSWTNVLADAAAVTAAVRAPEFAGEHRLDPERLAIAGHSLGGFTALMTAAADPSIAAVISLAAVDFGSVASACRTDPSARASWVESFDGSLHPLRGTSGEALAAELEATGDAWSLPALAPRLADRPVLLIGAARDTIAVEAEHFRPVVDAYLAHPVNHLEHHLFPTDHAFSDHRVTLTRTIADFLTRHLGKP